MFFLLIVLYTGQATVYEYPNVADCEAALIQKTDMGNYKHIKTAVCINSEENRL